MSSLLEQASLIVTPNATKAGKLYSIKPTDESGDLDVVRATTATRVNSAGLIESVANNVPRLDYTNGSCPSILVEPQRTNLALRSEDFSDAIWIKAGLPIMNYNVAIAPDGEMTADRITVDDALSERCEQSFVILANTQYIFSVYLKAGTQNIGQPFLNTTAQGAVNTEVAISNEWVRYSLIIPNTNTLTNIIIRIYPSSFSPVGAFGDNILVWGAQLELGSNATSYIKTEATAVTRNADVISKTGISDLIGQSEGSIYAEVNISELGSGNKNICQLSIDGSNRFSIQDTGTVSRVLILSNEFSATSFNFTRISVGLNKVCLVYTNGLWKIFRNGVLAGQQANGVYTSNLDFLNFGSGGIPLSTSGQLNDRINLLSLYKVALSDAQAIQLTTL